MQRQFREGTLYLFLGTYSVQFILFFCLLCIISIIVLFILLDLSVHLSVIQAYFHHAHTHVHESNTFTSFIQE